MKPPPWFAIPLSPKSETGVLGAVSCAWCLASVETSTEYNTSCLHGTLKTILSALDASFFLLEETQNGDLNNNQTIIWNTSYIMIHYWKCWATISSTVLVAYRGEKGKGTESFTISCIPPTPDPTLTLLLYLLLHPSTVNRGRVGWGRQKGEKDSGYDIRETITTNGHSL